MVTTTNIHPTFPAILSPLSLLVGCLVRAVGELPGGVCSGVHEGYDEDDVEGLRAEEEKTDIVGVKIADELG